VRYGSVGKTENPGGAVASRNGIVERGGGKRSGVAGSRRNEEKAHIAEFTFWSLMAYGDTGVAIAHRGQSPAFPLGMRLWFQVTVVPE